MTQTVPEFIDELRNLRNQFVEDGDGIAADLIGEAADRIDEMHSRLTQVLRDWRAYTHRTRGAKCPIALCRSCGEVSSFNGDGICDRCGKVA